MNRILIVEDEPKSIRLLTMVLEEKGHTVAQAVSVTQARAFLEEEIFDLMVTDVRLPDGSGLELLEHARQSEPTMPVIVVTAYGSVNDAVKAMQVGALEYVQKPFELEAMALVVEKALEQAAIRAEHRYLLEEGVEEDLTGRIVGESAAMAKVRELVERVAATNSNVLVTGESGTGKEVVAIAIQRASARRRQPLIRVNCPAIPAHLFESELFGHMKGAFTGAFESRKGKFELAGHGTVFLDEISEIPIDLQSKLLRVIEARNFARVGGCREVHMDARIVAATNQDLKALVDQGQFREDLYYRLNVFPIHIRPLREHVEDIPELAEHLLIQLRRHTGVRCRGILPEVIEVFLHYDWPGNVRELRNVLERAVVLADRGIIGQEHLPEEILESRSRDAVDSFHGRVDAFKRKLLVESLERTGWRKKHAAENLGLSQRAFSHYVKRYDLDSEKPLE